MKTFKPISHHKDYEISNFGDVRNCHTSKLLKPTVHFKKGRKVKYLRIELKNPRKKYLIHRLVAEAFIENPDNFPQVNHKDENGLNNKVSNLEWCDTLYNCTYSQGRPVNQLNLSGDLINTFESISQADRITGSDFRNISAVCLGKRKTHNKCKWEYATLE